MLGNILIKKIKELRSFLKKDIHICLPFRTVLLEKVKQCKLVWSCSLA